MTQYISMRCPTMHPRLREVLQSSAPPSPMAVPRDRSQPREGDLHNIHTLSQSSHCPILPKQKVEKTEVKISLDSALLRRRRCR